MNVAGIIILAGVVFILSFGLLILGLVLPQKSTTPRIDTAPPRTDTPLPRTDTSLPRTRLQSPYERIPTILTAAERDFLAVLQQTLPPGYALLMQVRLANLVQVKKGLRNDKSHWWRIQAKCVDFVLTDAYSFAPRLVIELDDSSHQRADRRERDAFVDQVLNAVGLPILHVSWQRSYDPQSLSRQINNQLGIFPVEPAVYQPSLSTLPAVTDGLWKPILNEIPLSTSAPPTIVSYSSNATRVVCGRCQAEIRPEAKYCGQCGAVFAG